MRLTQWIPQLSRQPLCSTRTGRQDSGIVAPPTCCPSRSSAYAVRPSLHGENRSSDWGVCCPTPGQAAGPLISANKRPVIRICNNTSEFPGISRRNGDIYLPGLLHDLVAPSLATGYYLGSLQDIGYYIDGTAPVGPLDCSSAADPAECQRIPQRPTGTSDLLVAPARRVLGDLAGVLTGIFSFPRSKREEIMLALGCCLTNVSQVEQCHG